MSIVEWPGVESSNCKNCKTWAEKVLKAEKNFFSSACVCGISCRFWSKVANRFKHLGNEKKKLVNWYYTVEEGSALSLFRNLIGSIGIKSNMRLFKRQCQ